MNNPSFVANAQRKILMAQDAVIESHNKKLRQAFDKATATRDHVAIVQHALPTPQGHPVNDQSKISRIHKAQKAETIALSNLSKAAAASALLSHTGSGKVGVLLPAVSQDNSSASLSSWGSQILEGRKAI
jgi:primosomal protein N'